MSHASTFPMQRSGRNSSGFVFSLVVCVCRIAFVLSGAKKFLTFGAAKSFSTVVVDEVASESLIAAAPAKLVVDVGVVGKISSVDTFNG